MSFSLSGLAFEQKDGSVSHVHMRIVPLCLSLSAFISILWRIVLPGGYSDSFIMKYFLKVVHPPYLPQYVEVRWSLAAPAGMCFIHYIFRTNPLDITLFCFSSCWYLFDSVSPHLTHMFSVIKFFQFPGTCCGGRGCIGFENLEASLCCIRLLVSVYFSQIHAPTHRRTESQNPSWSF